MANDTIEHLKETPDAQIVLYSNFIEGGVGELDKVLDFLKIPHGLFIGAGTTINNKKVTKESRDADVKKFKEGKSKVIVLSSAGAEGISLDNATMFLSLDGHFNPERILQAEARARRLGGQQHRAVEDRKVIVKRYRSVLPKKWWSAFTGKPDMSVDEWVYQTAQSKFSANKRLLEHLKVLEKHEEGKGKGIWNLLFGSEKEDGPSIADLAHKPVSPAVRAAKGEAPSDEQDKEAAVKAELDLQAATIKDGEKTNSWLGKMVLDGKKQEAAAAGKKFQLPHKYKYKYKTQDGKIHYIYGQGQPPANTQIIQD